MREDLDQGNSGGSPSPSSHPGTCERRGRWFGGCEFEARYDSEPTNGAGFTDIRGISADDLVKLLTKRKYVRDICVTCGRTIERGE